MKRLYIFPALLIAVGGTILLQSYSNGPAAQGFGATGAPGESGNNCVTCHSGGSFNTAVDIRLLDGGNAVTEYEPGKTYDMEVEVTAASGTPSGYGFQLLSLLDSDNSNVSGWTNPSSNAKLSSANNRDYVEHNGTSATGTFSVEWTAPAAGSGDITFYGAGNAVNGNGATSGDSPIFGDLTIPEMVVDTVPTDTTDTTNSIYELDRMSLSIYPNPAIDVITITSDFNRTQVEILNINGQYVKSLVATRDERIDVSDLEPGIYFVRLEGTQRMERILKL